jgi:hypothetical protein
MGIFAKPKEHQSICITFKPEEAEATDANHLDLFPASMFENAEEKSSGVESTEQQGVDRNSAEGEEVDDDAVGEF